MPECSAEELESLRSETRRFLNDVAPLRSVRQQFDRESGFDESIWKRMSAELALPGLHLPEAYGGQGLGYRVASIVAEESGRVLAQAPYMSNAFAGALILAGCTDQEKAEFLPGLASGDTIISVALAEQAANSWYPASVKMTVDGVDDALTLRGDKSLVLAASSANLLLVVVRDRQGGLAVLAVDPSDARVALDPLVTLDLTRPMWRVEFRDAPARRLGGSIDWARPVQDALNRTAVLLASEMVGGAQSCLEAAVAYSKDRHQFGRPIGAFQALKHKAADVVVEIELARAAVERAASLMDMCGRDPLSEAAMVAAAAAKVQADIAFRRSSLEALHMHGGIGFTWEHDSHLFVRRAQASMILFGSPAQFEATVTRHIVELPHVAVQEDLAAAVVASRPDLAAFASQALAWLEQNAKPVTSENAPPIGVIREVTDDADLEAFRAWSRLKQACGLAGLNWPLQYGGQGLSFQHLVVWNSLAQEFDAPEDACIVGTAMAGPIILRSGDDAQRAHYLPKILSGEHIWCQLFSEPGAGSDLAGLRTRAEKVDGGWKISGQKVWSSVAQFADWGLLLARTDPTAPKHKGLTCFVLDMTSPGVTVRPIRQMNEGAGFNEVFLDDVLLPESAVVGKVNEGWRVALETLNEERKLLGGRAGVNFQKLVNLAKQITVEGEPAIVMSGHRARLTALYVRLEALRALNGQARAAVTADSEPDVRLPVAKLVTSATMNDAARLALDIQGPSGALAGADAPEDGVWQLAFLGAPARRIAGGADEIQRNIIAERFLGMPAEPRLDKDKPFAADRPEPGRTPERARSNGV